MSQDSKNHQSGHPFRLPPRWRWVFLPVITLSGGGTAATLWLQEEAILLAEFAPIAAIPGMAALVYWFNHRLFKASMPRSEDLKTPSTRKNIINKKD